MFGTLKIVVFIKIASNNYVGDAVYNIHIHDQKSKKANIYEYNNIYVFYDVLYNQFTLQTWPTSICVPTSTHVL